MEDPRSTKDKAWTKAANERIVEYLVSHNYDRQISPKSLSAPTKKDYLHTLAFLYNKIDPLFEFADEKVEKAEVAIIAMFKRLKYPISISKAHLQAIGAPQSMPSLTASMLWLVELLEYEGRVDVARQEEFSPGDENPDKMFFDLLARHAPLALLPCCLPPPGIFDGLDSPDFHRRILLRAVCGLSRGLV